MILRAAGGPASKLAMFYENAMNSFMYNARPHGFTPPSTIQSLERGWHGKFSTYSMGFLDGHAEHKFVDTRYTDDANHSTWPVPGTPRGW